MLMGSVAEFIWREETLRWPTFFAGWGVALGSFVLRRWSIAALGRFWSLHVEIRENHQLVQSGPYRWIRHPAYCSMIMELLAGGLILNAFCALAATLLLFVPTLLWRLRLEEAALVEKFGESYRLYQRRTPALFPYKWPLIKQT
jgi:protein-S-isoprenylcysteine O-methyltransferase Ste14